MNRHAAQCHRGSALRLPVSAWLVLCVLCSGRTVADARRRRAAAGAAGRPATLVVAGLTAPVRIVRDTWGVPHIYAANAGRSVLRAGVRAGAGPAVPDGSVAAIGAGPAVGGARPELHRARRDDAPHPVPRRSRGRVGELRTGREGDRRRRSCAASTPGSSLARERPPEEFVLAGWKPEPWSADDLLNRTDAFTASGDALDEVFRARLIAAVGLARARLLLPEIARSIRRPASIRRVVPASGRRDDPPRRHAAVLPRARRRRSPTGTVRVEPADAGSVRLQPDRRSRRTRSSVAALFRPPQRAGLERDRRDRAVASRCRRGAQRSRRLDADADRDRHAGRLRREAEPGEPAPGRRSAAAGSTSTSRKDFIAVRGRKTPVDFTTETTRHGVIVASDLERHLAFAIRWSGTEPGTAAELAAPALDRAASLPRIHGRAERTGRCRRAESPTSTRGERRAADGGLRAGAARMERRDAGAGLDRRRRVEQLDRRRRRRASGATGTGRATQMLLDALRAASRSCRRAAAGARRGLIRPDALTAQRAVLVDALADALRERALPASGSVLFAHPLGVTDAARRRFNVVAHAPAGAARDSFAMTFDPTDWDRSTAINAPGQSGSAESAALRRSRGAVVGGASRSRWRSPNARFRRTRTPR